MVIEDNGHGMSREEMIKGFMTLSSTTKIHEPLSPRYQRQRAGRKGIGRFATQFLGERLVITTQTNSSEKALRLSIDWNDYIMDKDISSIENAIEEIECQPYTGTTIHINKLRHSWTVAQIKRVFRYVTDLLQPSFLSDNSSKLNIASQGDSTFLVECYRTENGLTTIIADINKILFEKALAEIDGYVNELGDGYVKIKSESFNIDDSDFHISAGKRTNAEIKSYDVLKSVHFKAYYFIYDRPEYYKNGITWMFRRYVTPYSAAN